MSGLVTLQQPLTITKQVTLGSSNNSQHTPSQPNVIVRTGGQEDHMETQLPRGSVILVSCG